MNEVLRTFLREQFARLIRHAGLRAQRLYFIALRLSIIALQALFHSRFLAHFVDKL